jgi:hypothetical protein
MKRIYIIFVTLILALATLTPTAWADDPPTSSAVDTVETSARSRSFLDISGWQKIAHSLTRFRTNPPTTQVNPVIYPLPADAKVNPFWDTRQTVIFYTSLSMEEVMDFYREGLGEEGAIERELLTVTDEEAGAWFSMVFDGWKADPSRAVVIQGVLISPTEYVVSIRREKV